MDYRGKEEETRESIVVVPYPSVDAGNRRDAPWPQSPHPSSSLTFEIVHSNRVRLGIPALLGINKVLKLVKLSWNVVV